MLWLRVRFSFGVEALRFSFGAPFPLVIGLFEAVSDASVVLCAVVRDLDPFALCAVEERIVQLLPSLNQVIIASQTGTSRIWAQLFTRLGIRPVSLRLANGQAQISQQASLL